MWLNVEIVITQKCFQLGYYATVSVTHAAPSCKGPGPTTQPFGCDVRVSSQQVHRQLVKLVMWRDRRWSSKQSDNCSVVASSHGGHTPPRHRSCQVTSLLLLSALSGPAPPHQLRPGEGWPTTRNCYHSYLTPSHGDNQVLSQILAGVLFT